MASIVNYCARFPDEDSDRLKFVPPLTTQSFLEIEAAKLHTVARLAREALESAPECHVVVCLRFIDHLKLMEESLREFAPTLVTTKTLGAQDTRLVIISHQAFKQRNICWEIHPRQLFFTLPIRFDQQLRVDFRHPDTTIRIVYDQKNTAELALPCHRKYGQHPRLDEV